MISSKEAAAAAAALAGMRKTFGGGRPAIERRCPHCRLKFKARDLARHEPTCRALHNPTEEPKAGRPLGWRKPVVRKRAKAKSKG